MTATTTKSIRATRPEKKRPARCWNTGRSENNTPEGSVIMTQTIERPAKKASAKAPGLITMREAAKRHGIGQWWVIEAAIKENNIEAIRKEKFRGCWDEYLVGVESLDRWIANLTEVEKVVVFPCTRKGCCKWVDGESHMYGVTPEGLAEHGMTIYSNYPRVPGKQCAQWFPNHEDHPTEWLVALRATGDEPWQIVVEVKNFQVWLNRSNDRGTGAYYGHHDLPDPDLLAEAMAKAVAKRDKLNAELAVTR